MKNDAWWQRALSWGAYPVLVFGGTGLAAVTLNRGWLPPEWLGSVFVLAVGLLVIVFERLVPFRTRRPSLRTVWVDLLHNFLSVGGTTAILRAVLWGVGIWLGARASELVGGTLWPDRWPLLSQLALAAVLGELGNYWAHRWMHRSDRMWRIHALHHSPDHLYLIASGRSHPLNALLSHFTQVAPAILLGASPELVALLAVFTAVTGLLQHCNARMHTEWLSWLLATPDLHRTHHSTVLEESNSNFANNLILWDIVFGTWRRLPPPEAYGVPEVDWPESYLGQLATPFVYEEISERQS